MNNVLELTNVTKHYNGFTLDNVSLSLPAGSIMGFVGENGAGKSTTIKCILNLINKDSGSIQLFGKDHTTITNLTKEDIGVVIDECCFPEVMTPQQINKCLKHTFLHWESNTFEQYMKTFNIPMNKQVKDLSRGMKMKLSIACALSHQAKLLILDEATSGLDPIVRDEILDIFLEFIQDESHSIFMSSHITSDLEKICDYISLIHKGKLIFTKTKDELLEDYGILKCSKEEFARLTSSAVIAYRKNEFGIQALVHKNKLGNGFLIDAPSIEDIMLFYIRGEKL